MSRGLEDSDAMPSFPYTVRLNSLQLFHCSACKKTTTQAVLYRIQEIKQHLNFIQTSSPPSYPNPITPLHKPRHSMHPHLQTLLSSTLLNLPQVKTPQQFHKHDSQLSKRELLTRTIARPSGEREKCSAVWGWGGRDPAFGKEGSGGGEVFWGTHHGVNPGGDFSLRGVSEPGWQVGVKETGKRGGLTPSGIS